MSRRISQKNNQIMFAKLAMLTFVFSVFFYLYMCASLVFDGVYLKKLSAQIKKENIELASLESNLSKTQSSLSVEDAKSFGLIENKNTYFAVRKNEVAAFSMIYER